MKFLSLRALFSETIPAQQMALSLTPLAMTPDVENVTALLPRRRMPVTLRNVSYLLALNTEEDLTGLQNLSGLSNSVEIYKKEKTAWRIL